nr:MAG TPA: hypothetical protein [Caudoviricetes sp.]
MVIGIADVIAARMWLFSSTSWVCKFISVGNLGFECSLSLTCWSQIQPARIAICCILHPDDSSAPNLSDTLL